MVHADLVWAFQDSWLAGAGSCVAHGSGLKCWSLRLLHRCGTWRAASIGAQAFQRSKKPSVGLVGRGPTKAIEVGSRLSGWRSRSTAVGRAGRATKARAGGRAGRATRARRSRSRSTAGGRAGRATKTRRWRSGYEGAVKVTRWAATGRAGRAIGRGDGAGGFEAV